MKKVILAIAFVVLGTTAMIAQDKDQDRVQDQDRLMLVDGDVLQIRDQDQIRLKDKKTLNDGTTVNADGSYLTRDRDRLRLKDGECLDSDGIKYRNEYQYRYKIQQENKGLTKSQIQERNQNRVHYTLMDGEMFQIKNQSQNRIQSQLKLNDGSIVNADGTYQTRDRKQLRLQEGECLSMDGQMFKNTNKYRKMNLKKIMLNKRIQKKPKTQKMTNKKVK
ncbi:DUF6799 domain-containing protein [Olleya namhaensis]|uniref:DUF6799 domain-containing protein n=1 Tax=Olleya namhaensis TaxID=1144750 RepID=UPI00232AD85C|nr:DUF6799 domain-containing protein [Olleya namhaensis]